MSRAGRPVDLGRPVERLGEGRRTRADDQEVLDVDAPAAACAPPPKIWISGSGSVTGLVAAPAIAPERQPRGCRGGVGHAPSRPRWSRCRRAAPCSACRRARSGAASTAAWSAASRPVSAGAIVPFTRATARRHVEAAEALAAVAQVDRLAACRSRRPPGAIARPDGAAGQRDLGLDRRPAAAVPDPPAAHRGDRGRAHAATSSRPGVARSAARRPARLGQEPARARARTRSLSRLRRSGTRPATCRRPARGRGRAAGRPRAPRARRAAPRRRPRDRPRPARRSRRGSAAAAAGVHRHFSSRWLRQKARSKAGSPYQAHSASRNTGPSGPDQDVLGADVAVDQGELGRRGAAARRAQRLARGPVRARRSPAGRARAGWRGRSRRSGRRRRRPARCAVAAWMRGEALAQRRGERRDRPCRRAAAASTARWCCGSR